MKEAALPLNDVDAFLTNIWKGLGKMPVAAPASPCDVLQALAEGMNSDFVFFSVTEDGVFNYVSEGWQQVIGRPSESLIGTPYTDLLTDSLCNKTLGRVGSTARGENERGFAICEVKHADGTLRTLHVCKGPIVFADGTRGTVGFARDLSRDQAGILHIEEPERLAAQNSLRTLDERQWEILARIVDGWPNKQIAARLRVSQRTVEAERARILRKLGASHFSDAVRTYLIGTAPACPAVSEPVSP